jgi:selenocysteine lyase/cysteine desulfurase
MAEWRAEFPVTSRCVYFDHAGVAPVSRRVAAAVRAFATDACDFARLHYRVWEERAEVVRARAADLVGAEADEIAFVANTSDGLATIAGGLDWRAGDSVVVPAEEFPANVYPWWDLARLGVETRTVPIEHGRLTVDAVARVMDASTRVLSVSAVDFATGQRRPLAALGALCWTRGVLFCVDAIQALGAVRLDVTRDQIDCLAADGHKWLCAPEGCGVLYVSRRWSDRIAPSRLGWKSVVDHGRYLPYHFEIKADAGRFECGSLNFLGIHALGAALDLLTEVGSAVVEAAVLANTALLRDELRRRDYVVLSPDEPAERAGITTTRVDDPVRVVAALRAVGVLASPRGGGVRLSPHFYCDASDVARCLDALDAATRRAGS